MIHRDRNRPLGTSRVGTQDLERRPTCLDRTDLHGLCRRYRRVRDPDGECNLDRGRDGDKPRPAPAVCHLRRGSWTVELGLLGVPSWHSSSGLLRRASATAFAGDQIDELRAVVRRCARRSVGSHRLFAVADCSVDAVDETSGGSRHRDHRAHRQCGENDHDIPDRDRFSRSWTKSPAEDADGWAWVPGGRSLSRVLWRANLGRAQVRRLRTVRFVTLMCQCHGSRLRRVERNGDQRRRGRTVADDRRPGASLARASDRSSPRPGGEAALPSTVGPRPRERSDHDCRDRAAVPAVSRPAVAWRQAAHLSRGRGRRR